MEVAGERRRPPSPARQSAISSLHRPRRGRPGCAAGPGPHGRRPAASDKGTPLVAYGRAAAPRPHGRGPGRVVRWSRRGRDGAGLPGSPPTTPEARRAPGRAGPGSPPPAAPHAPGWGNVEGGGRAVRPPRSGQGWPRPAPNATNRPSAAVGGPRDPGSAPRYRQAPPPAHPTPSPSWASMTPLIDFCGWAREPGWRAGVDKGHGAGPGQAATGSRAERGVAGRAGRPITRGLRDSATPIRA